MFLILLYNSYIDEIIKVDKVCYKINNENSLMYSKRDIFSFYLKKWDQIIILNILNDLINSNNKNLEAKILFSWLFSNFPKWSIYNWFIYFKSKINTCLRTWTFWYITKRKNSWFSSFWKIE